MRLRGLSTTGLCPAGYWFLASRKCFPGRTAGLSNSLPTCASTANGLFPTCQRSGIVVNDPDVWAGKLRRLFTERMVAIGEGAMPLWYKRLRSGPSLYCCLPEDYDATSIGATLV